ncbi:MAG: hemerythrin domain-containing protein [Deltaproteobacteria bacterium]|nr:hemerythrin domain-containing protein [Deltaproteobacteria bacterium]
MSDLVQIGDPVRRQEERGCDQPDGLSPMDPPDAYAPPGETGGDDADLGKRHPYLRALTDDHARLMEAMALLEEKLAKVREAGFTADVDVAVMRFLETFDREFIAHSREEEARLFPLLHERLIADGEHSKGRVITTAIDVMKDEHLKAVQLAAVVLNLMRLGTVLPDERSADLVIKAALGELKKLVELLRLHIFREDGIVFARAQGLIALAELDAMGAAGRRRDS